MQSELATEKPTNIMGRKAVELAKDVLKQLDSYNVKSHGGAYATLNMSLNKDDQAKKHFSKLKKCQVCALGACFLSYIHKWNNVTIREITCEGVIDVERDTIVEKLKDVFTPVQLSCIEQAFEVTYWSNHAQKFGIKYKTDKARLRAIMNNIIKNNGEFVP